MSEEDGEEVDQTAKLAKPLRISNFHLSPLQVTVHLSLATQPRRTASPGAYQITFH